MKARSVPVSGSSAPTSFGLFGIVDGALLLLCRGSSSASKVEKLNARVRSQKRCPPLIVTRFPQADWQEVREVLFGVDRLSTLVFVRRSIVRAAWYLGGILASAATMLLSGSRALKSPLLRSPQRPVSGYPLGRLHNREGYYRRFPFYLPFISGTSASLLTAARSL